MEVVVVVVVVVVRPSSASGDVELQGSLPTYGNVELQGGLTRIRDQGRCVAPSSLPSRGFGALEVVTLAYPSWALRRVVDGVLIRSSGLDLVLGVMDRGIGYVGTVDEVCVSACVVRRCG